MTSPPSLENRIQQLRAFLKTAPEDAPDADDQRLGQMVALARLEQVRDAPGVSEAWRKLEKAAGERFEEAAAAVMNVVMDFEPDKQPPAAQEVNEAVREACRNARKLACLIRKHRPMQVAIDDLGVTAPPGLGLEHLLKRFAEIVPERAAAVATMPHRQRGHAEQLVFCRAIQQALSGVLSQPLDAFVCAIAGAMFLGDAVSVAAIKKDRQRRGQVRPTQGDNKPTFDVSSPVVSATRTRL